LQEELLKMPFVKVQKNKAYFKRFQVKYRRRRAGKTDYYARRRLIVQHKAKYNTPKYRFVVRLTNRYVICQVTYSVIDSDRVITSAYSSELPRYGMPTGLKNYAACYATGLLCARRLLYTLSQGVDAERQLASLYPGVDAVSGEIIETEDDGRTYFVEEVNDDVRPFRAFLDVGLRPTTSGHRVFAALKGAVDGGLDIPHNNKRFFMDEDDGEKKIYTAESMRERILGGGVKEYMEQVQETDEEEGTKNFETKFAGYAKAGLGPDNLEEAYLKCHSAIRKDPAPKHKDSNRVREYEADRKTKKPNAKRAASLKQFPKQKNARKISDAQRKGRVRQKKDAMIRASMVDDDDDDE
jgi:large subunit ribosomal protein L5e